MDFVLTGDDDTIEESSLGCTVKSVGQRHCRTERSYLHLDTNPLHTTLDQFSVLPMVIETTTTTTNRETLSQDSPPHQREENKLENDREEMRKYMYKEYIC